MSEKTTGKFKLDKSLKALIDRVTKSFLITMSDEELFKEFNSTDFAESDFNEIAEAFCSNIVGTNTTVSFPYSLAHSAAAQKHYQRIHIAERIRSLKVGESKDDEGNDDVRETIAAEKARLKFEGFMSSSEGVNIVVKDSLEFLDASLRNDELSESSNEMLLQGAVLCWSALEVLVRDTFVMLLNQRPQLAQNLLEDRNAKRRFDMSKVSMETLLEHNFDLSDKMGKLLEKQQDFSDINSIKAVFEALFSNDGSLRNHLSNENIRILSQRRNLIVHRRAIVDDIYIKSTKCSQKVGEKIYIEADELEEHMKQVVKLANSILGAVTTYSKQK